MPGYYIPDSERELNEYNEHLAEAEEDDFNSKLNDEINNHKQKNIKLQKAD